MNGGQDWVDNTNDNKFFLFTDIIIMICNDCDLNLFKRFEVDTK